MIISDEKESEIVIGKKEELKSEEIISEAVFNRFSRGFKVGFCVLTAVLDVMFVKSVLVTLLFIPDFMTVLAYKTS